MPTTMKVTVEAAPCGVRVQGLDLRRPLPVDEVAALRRLWLAHQVLAIDGQDLSLEDLERAALSWGPYGIDPYFESVPGHPHIAQVKREADETSSIFADAWHSDWSFLASPPAATLLYGNVIPPVGGDTLFANMYAAYDALSDRMKELLGERVRDVRASQRLTDSASCLVCEEHDMGPQMARLLKQAGHDVPASKPILEINPSHPLVKRLESEADAERARDLGEILLDQAQLAEGGQLDDPAAYVARVNKLLAASLGG